MKAKGIVRRTARSRVRLATLLWNVAKKYENGKVSERLVLKVCVALLKCFFFFTIKSQKVQYVFYLYFERNGIHYVYFMGFDSTEFGG